MKELKDILANHPFMDEMDPHHFEELLACAEMVRFDSEEVILRQGDVAARFFLLLKGEVVLEEPLGKGSRQPIQTLRAGEVLGWSWLFPPYLWQNDARAATPVEAVALNGAHLLIACEENHDLGFDLMKRISQVLIHNLRATRQRLIEATHPETAA